MKVVRGVRRFPVRRRRTPVAMVTAAMLVAAGSLTAVADVNPVEITGFPISETFTTANLTNDWTLLGSPVPAALTATGSQTNGWLQLTNTSQYQSGSAVLNTPFNSSLGIVVDFQYAIFGYQSRYGPPGDGFSFFLINGTAPATTGAVGSGLGYACNRDPGNLTTTNCTSDRSGVTGGYVGIGFDAYGNYSTTYTGNNTGTGTAAVPNQIVVRGSGDGITGFRYLTGTAAPGNDVTTGGTTSNPGVRSVRITISHSTSSGPGVSVGDELLSVSSTSTGGTTLQPVITNFNLTAQQASPIGNCNPASYTVANMCQQPLESTPTLKLGFAASTGYSTSYHYIRNLTVTAPTDMSIAKTAPSSVSRGSAIRYTLVATNKYYNPVDGAVVQDTVPAGVTGISWTCTVPEDSGAECGAGSVTGNVVTVTVGFAEQGDTVQIVITGTVIAAANSPPITNTATITPPDGLTDLNPVDNTATVSTTIVAGELTITVPVAAELDETTPGGTTSGQIGPVTVSDYRPGPGPMTWTATVTWTQFTGPGTSVIPPDRITYWSGGPVGTPVGTGNFVPGQLDAGDAAGLPGLGPGGSVIAFTLPPPGGSVDNSVTWNPTLVVSVPYGVSAGDYIGTVLHSVA